MNLPKYDKLRFKYRQDNTGDSIIMNILFAICTE